MNPPQYRPARPGGAGTSAARSAGSRKRPVPPTRHRPSPVRDGGLLERQPVEDDPHVDDLADFHGDAFRAGRVLHRDGVGVIKHRRLMSTGCPGTGCSGPGRSCRWIVPSFKVRDGMPRRFAIRCCVFAFTSSDHSQRIQSGGDWSGARHHRHLRDSTWPAAVPRAGACALRCRARQARRPVAPGWAVIPGSDTARRAVASAVLMRIRRPAVPPRGSS
jgi:hypothetical protein